ncbi:MAG: flagellar protein FlaG [Bacillales bacterium]|jgi:flagellar protein FlaG|nr:flagellar protein FlaG [Bacillales bacterium]
MKLSSVTNQMPDLKVDQIDSVRNIKVNSEREQEQPNSDLSKEQAEKVVKSVNEFLKGTSTQLAYKFHEGLNEYYAVVVDENTNQVVSEIPSKKLLDIFAAMTEYTGLLLDKKA